MTDWRSQKRQARVTLVEVHNAINHLKLQGIHNPSLRAIHGVIGRGSLDKINALRKQLDDNHPLLKDGLHDRKDIPKSSLEDIIKDNLKDVYSRLNDIEGQLSLNLDDKVDVELNTALGELRQMWLDAVSQYQLSCKWPNVKEADEALDDLHQLWLDAVEQSSLFQEKLYEARELWLNAVDLWIEKIELAKSLQTKNADLESKLEAVQSEAQATIDELNQKRLEDKTEIQRQTKEYSDLHQKYADLKAKLDTTDGSAPAAKKKKRDPVVLDSEIVKTEEATDYIIDTDKAKARVGELTKEGLDHKEITKQLESEGYRTKGLLGDIKPYLSNNIGKWQRKFKQKGSI